MPQPPNPFGPGFTPPPGARPRCLPDKETIHRGILHGFSVAPFRRKVLGSLPDPINRYFLPFDAVSLPSQAFPPPPPETGTSLHVGPGEPSKIAYSSFGNLRYNRIHQIIEGIGSRTKTCQTAALVWQLSELDYFRYEDPSSTMKRMRERQEVWGENAEVLVVCNEDYQKFFQEIVTKRKRQVDTSLPFTLPLPTHHYNSSFDKPHLGSLVAVVARQQVRMQCSPTLLLSSQRLARRWEVECTCYTDTEISVLPEYHIPSEAEKQSTTYRPDLERFTHV